MAIKKCLYCDTGISEFADPCPKCKAKHPHDEEFKRHLNVMFARKGSKEKN
jgi:hypothetical protein